MNFHEFQKFRLELLQREPDVVDLAETNIWRSLNHLIPTIPLRPEKHVHRCHLAELWINLFDLPAEWSKFALISCGVRHSLSLLLMELSKRGGQLVMPFDVYPVYGQIAATSGTDVVTFPTVPDLSIPDCGDWLLLPNPLKPAGRWLGTKDVNSVRRWLAERPERRVLIDAVYNFQTNLHATTLELIETQQAIVMHSLSKTWLHPQVLGVCLVSENDWNDLAPIFRSNSPDQPNLQLADYLMRSESKLPNQVDKTITHKRAELRRRLPAELTRMQVENEAGYFTLLESSFKDLLQSHRILTIPLSVFGSELSNVAAASSL